MNLKETIQHSLSQIKKQKSHNFSLKISQKDKLSFLEAFSNLLNSGIPVNNAFKIIIYQTKSPKLKILLERLLENTTKGKPIKDSFTEFHKIFNNFDISLIEMGEVTGKLGEVIEIIKDKEEKTRELKSKVIGALIYPMVIMTLATAMIGVFMVYVIPKITDMYKDAKVNLPSLTQHVIDISNFLQLYYHYVIVGFILFALGIKIFKKNKKTKIHWDKYTLKIPVFGVLIRKKILAIFTSSMGTLLTQGVMINQALKITAGALENDYYEKEILAIVKKVSTGKSLSNLMGVDLIASGKENKYFPIELSSVIKIGEQTGNMPSLLKKISIKFNKDIDTTVKNLATAIEPIVIVLVGGIVGTIIMAVMLPFFNMVNVI